MDRSRQQGHVVAGSDDKDGRRLFLEPDEKAAKHTGRRASVGQVGTGRACQPFFQFVEPQSSGRNRLCRAQSVTDVLFRGAHHLAENLAHIQAQQG